MKTYWALINRFGYPVFIDGKAMIFRTKTESRAAWIVAIRCKKDCVFVKIKIHKHIWE